MKKILIAALILSGLASVSQAATDFKARMAEAKVFKPKMKMASRSTSGFKTFGSQTYWYSGNGVGSQTYWYSGSGPGSQTYWYSGSGPGSQSYWFGGSGAGSQSYWFGGSGPGSQSYWFGGSGEGSQIYWFGGSGAGELDKIWVGVCLGLDSSSPEICRR